MIIDIYMDLKYDLQQKKMDICRIQADRITFASENKQEVILNSCNFIRENNFDPEAFSYLQERLQEYNLKHLGKPAGRAVEMALADNTWMYVLMNPEHIKMYPEYQEVNDLYNIHPELVRR